MCVHMHVSSVDISVFSQSGPGVVRLGRKFKQRLGRVRTPLFPRPFPLFVLSAPFQLRPQPLTGNMKNDGAHGPKMCAAFLSRKTSESRVMLVA